MFWEAYIKSVQVSSGAIISAYYCPAHDSDLPLLLLLHGYPQNNKMWKEFIALLPSKWSLFIPDLPGYGESLKGIANSSSPFSKRSMGTDILEAINAIHNVQASIIVVGHDRGARVAYRMALDNPSRVVGLGVLDIVPTIYVWAAMGAHNDHFETKRTHHWVFLASPRPLPETLIGHNPDWYFRWTINSWGREVDPKSNWIADSVLPYTQRSGQMKIAAACEDYRAGATIDVDDDREQQIDPSKPPRVVFTIPVLSLASAHLCRRFDVEGIWDSLTEPGKHQFFQVGNGETGHFIVNQETTETAKRVSDWLEEHWIST